MFSPASIIRSLMSNNQFASGGMLIMFLGGIGVALRKVPKIIWDWLLRRFTIHITIKDDDASFTTIKQWISQKYENKSRRIDLDSGLEQGKIRRMLAPGRHWIWIDKRLFIVNFDRETEKKGWTPSRTETITLTMLGRSQKKINKFLDELQILRNAERDYLWYYAESYWEIAKTYAPRKMDAIILPTGEKEKLIADIQDFLDSKDKYEFLGIPYHRGYLFHGLPGTGKSSLASALSNQFGLSIYSVSLNDLNNDKLRSAIRSVRKNSIILFEDVDDMSAVENRKDKKKKGPNKKDKTGVSLSGLLNALDGTNAASSVIYVMTTNHREKLDAALLRPGRIDYELKLGEATKNQKEKMFYRFYPNASADEAVRFVEREACLLKTMAEVQGALLLRSKKEKT